MSQFNCGQSWCVLCNYRSGEDTKPPLADETDPVPVRFTLIPAELPGRHYETCLGCKQRRICENGLLTLCDDCYAAWPGEDTDPQNKPNLTFPDKLRVKPVEQKGSGIARAVGQLNHHEYRLGCARFQP